MNTFALEIVTPYGRFHRGQASSALFSTPEGKLEILAGHEALVVAIEPCVLRVHSEAGTWIAAIGEGFARIKGTMAIILVDSAEKSTDIDIERARAALQRAQERLASTNPDWIRAQSRKAVVRAVARIEASGAERGRKVSSGP